MPRKKSFLDKIQEIKAEPGKRVVEPVPGTEGLLRWSQKIGQAVKVYSTG